MTRILKPDELMLEEIVELGAEDSHFFNTTFFPKTFRDPFPSFSGLMWDMLESTNDPFVNFQLFRGSSKTTTARASVAKRISYGISRVILLICASATKSYLTMQWIKNNVERNHPWASTFQLAPGSKWTDDIIEIRHGIYDTSIWIIGFGLTGKHRGINIDDYRPDYILVDDIIDEEVAASEEQRTKAEDLVLGSLIDSLAPETENPHSKMVLLQTPFNHDDLSMKALKDPMWVSLRQGCWTLATENLALEERKSVWEERFPSARLRQRKIGAIARNKVSLFSREMECKIVSPEESDFRREWLRFYTDVPGGYNDMYIVMAIDPVPPPSASEIAKGYRGKDYECFAIVGYKDGCYYLLDYATNRGHTPEWTIMTFFEMIYKWHPKKTRIETVAYQKTLEWLIKKAMESRRQYAVVEPWRDKRSKPDRIVDVLSGPASNYKLFVRPEHAEFITQFTDYPNVQHDDILDAVSMAMDGIINISLSDDDWEAISPYSKELDYIPGAP